MIQTKHDLKTYLEADKKALGRKKNKPSINDFIWKYEIVLRKCEYYTNTNELFVRGVLRKLVLLFYRYRRSVLGVKCGFSIPLNAIEKGLCLSHIGPIIINENVRIGENCRIHVGVNIGADFRVSDAAPIIGNNVYIGPGAKLFGKIEIADGIAIGANSVVNRSFFEKGISIAGAPARKISDKGTKGVLY